MKNIFYILWILVLAGCIEDQGTYDYKPIKELKVIDFPYSQDLTFGETYTFRPRLLRTKGDTISDFTCEWYVNGKIVSEERVYTFTSNELGTYNIYIRVIDQQTGISTFREGSIDVISPYKSGFLILHEGDTGNPQLSFLNAKEMNVDGRDTLIFDRFYENVYATENQSLLQGVGVSIYEHWANDDNNPPIGEITLITENGGYRIIEELNGETLKRETYIEQEFIGEKVPLAFSPQKILHSAWDSFILDESGMIYPRRSDIKEGYHTGYFSDEITYQNRTRFKDLIFGNYARSSVFYALKYQEDKSLNMIGIQQEVLNPRNNLSELPIVASDEIQQYFYGIKHEIVATDYLAQGDYDGGMAMMYKTLDNTYLLHIFDVTCASKRNVTIEQSAIINLTAEYGVDEIIDIFTSKLNRTVYVCTPQAIYSAVGNHSYLFDVEKIHDFGGRRVIAIDNKSIFNAYKSYGEHLAVAFEDGSFEVYQFLSPTKLSKPVYIAPQPIKNTKQVLEKVGNGSWYFSLY